MEMGLLDHLRELRVRLVRCVIAIAGGTIVAYSVNNFIFELLVKPFNVAFPNESLVGTSPAEAFTLKLTVAFFAGVLFSLPFLFFELWKFVAPALYEKERKLAIPFVILTTFFFVLGVAFCYIAVLPVTFSFFHDEYVSISLEPQITLAYQLKMTVQLLLAFGVIFELPVLSFVLARLGVLTSEQMRSSIRYLIVGIFIVGAVLTPPDVVSQMLMVAPMLVLLAISYAVVRMCEAKR